jgi:hypothetical protein
MRSITDPVHEGCDQTVHSPTDGRGSDGTIDAPRETDASCEAIERGLVRERRARRSTRFSGHT